MGQVVYFFFCKVNSLTRNNLQYLQYCSFHYSLAFFKLFQKFTERYYPSIKDHFNFFKKYGKIK